MRKITLLLTLLLTFVTSAVAQNYEPRENGTRTRTDRNVTAVSVTGATSGEQAYTLTAEDQLKDWADVTATAVFKVAPGEELTPRVEGNGSWVHYSVFVDFDGDGFTSGIEEGSEWKPTGDLVSYSFYNNGSTSDASGWNSKGDVISGDNRNKPALPAFTAPTEPGTYRMRFVQGWCNIDPAGDADGKFGDFKENGDQVIDVTLVVGEVETPEVPEVGGEDEATLAAIEKAEGVLAKTGVGYPAAESASRTALVAAVEEAKAAPTTENGTKVNAALATYLAETNVTLPETGKAYTFTMVAKNGNKFYLNYTGQDVAMVAATGEALPESAQFVATANSDGTYTFQTNDGNYLVYHSKYAGVSWLQGASTTGFQAEKDDMTNITLAKLSKGNNVAATDEQVFGLVSWYSMRGVRSDNNANEMGYMVLKADGSDYDGATAPFWNDNYSSAFLVEEVETTTPEVPATPLELVSVDPADGSELESVNKFTFTFNKPVTIGEEGGVTLSANGGTTTLEVIASDEETSVVTFSTGKEITVSGDYELKVAAGTFVDADGNTNEAMTFKYKVVSTANTLTLVSTNPSTDKVQTSLKRITLTFSEEVYYFDDVTINVTDEGGNVVTTGILDYGLNYEDMDVVLNDAITTPGKYTVTIPENCMFGYGNYNPEIVLTYTIGSEEPEVPEVPEEPYNTFVPTKITPAEGLVESLKEIVLDFGPNDYPGTNGLDMNSTFNLTNAAGDVVATGKLSYSGYTAAAVTLDKEIVEPGVYTIIIPEGSIWNSKVSGTADKGVSNGARCNPTLELTYEIKAATSVVAVDPACGHYEVMPATIKVTFSQEISAITFSRVRTDVVNDAYTLQATDMNINGKELTFTIPAEYVTEARNMLIMLSVVDANGNSVSYASNKETEIEGYVMLEYTADGITGINGITVEQLKDVYTLDGRKVVLTPGQKIKKGLYIVGGKKVYVK